MLPLVLMFVVPDNVRNVFTVAVAAGVPVIAVFLGITLVSQEMERKTIYIVLSKPVPRWEFVLGKAAGLCATILLTTSVMAVTLFAMT